MTQPVPAPVLDFFARFVANPDAKGLGRFCMELLNLEVGRAEYSILSDPHAVAVGDGLGDYKPAIKQAQRALNLARMHNSLNAVQFELRYYWLTLLGHRLAVERNLPAGGRRALRHVAAMRLDLPLKETEAWSDDWLFRRYTQTVLRDEWDYPGIQFRSPGSAWPPEGK